MTSSSWWSESASGMSWTYNTSVDKTHAWRESVSIRKPRRKAGASDSNAPSANHGASPMSTESSPAGRKRPYAYAKRGLSVANDGVGPYTAVQLHRMDARFAAALERAIRRGTETVPRGKLAPKT
jgi:hypothetical protein